MRRRSNRVSSASESSTSSICSWRVSEGAGWGAMLARARCRRVAVQFQPIIGDLAERLGKAREVDRLDDIAVGAELIAGDQVAFLARRGQNDHRQKPGFRARTNFPQDVQAADLGQVEVEEDDAWN